MVEAEKVRVLIRTLIEQAKTFAGATPPTREELLELE